MGQFLAGFEINSSEAMEMLYRYRYFIFKFQLQKICESKENIPNGNNELPFLTNSFPDLPSSGGLVGVLFYPRV